MEITEKVAYLKGLAEGMELNAEKKEGKLLLAIMKDITTQEREERRAQELRQQTLEVTDRIIQKQMRTVQEIASLLGETTAETKVALTKLRGAVAEGQSHE